MTSLRAEPSAGWIALLTDFGLTDCYVGLMKAVAASIAPGAGFIDLCHHVPPQSVLAGAAYLRQSAPYLPPGSVTAAVVDPGVGSPRRALAAESDGRYYVGPDNGLLSFVLNHAARIHAIVNPAFRLPHASATFHGRDIFAAAAAHLIRGVSLEELGPPVDDPILLEWPAPRREVTGIWSAPILATDHFGNCITTARRDDFEGVDAAEFHVNAAGRSIHGLSPTYSAAPPGRWLAYWGSAGLLEVAVNCGSAALEGSLRPGDSIQIMAGIAPNPANLTDKDS